MAKDNKHLKFERNTCNKVPYCVVRTFGRRIQEKIENFWPRLVGGVLFRNFHHN